MGFKITKDMVHIRPDEQPWNKTEKEFGCDFECSLGEAENYDNGQHVFRLLDGDANIYFEGLSDSNSCYCPLDWAKRIWGCTDIQYQNDQTGQWESI